MQGMDQTLMSLGMWSYDCQNVTELTKQMAAPTNVLPPNFQYFVAFAIGFNVYTAYGTHIKSLS
jgi:hypothetical protein